MSAYSFVRGFSSLHSGVDLSASRGTAVHAVAGGRVTYSGYSTSDRYAPASARGGGNVVHVDVGGHTEQYAHLDTRRVRTGQSIARGTVLGTVGSTGNATGPHLHFELLTGSGSRDPLSLYSRSALIAAVSDAGGRGTSVVPKGTPLTFWGVVTYPEGHILNGHDVPAIIATLDRAGYFRDDVTGIARRGLEGLLNALVGRRWDDQLATDIARGLGIGAEEVKKGLDPTDEIAQAIVTVAGQLLDGVGQLAARAGAFLLLAAFVVIGAYLVVTDG